MNIRKIMTKEQVASQGNYVVTNKTTDNLTNYSAACVPVSQTAFDIPICPSNTTDRNSGTYTSKSEAGETVMAEVSSNEANRNLAILSGEDYASFENEEGPLEKYQEESLDRAIERIHNEREWKEVQLEKNAELRETLQEDLEQIQANGFVSAKTEAQIREMLDQANLPATQDLIKQIITTLQMSRAVPEMTEESKRYLIEKSLPLSIEQIYYAGFSGSEAVSPEDIPVQVWEQYNSRIQELIDQNHWDSPEQIQQVKWLFANELPITSQNMDKLSDLTSQSQQYSLEDTLQRIVQSISLGTMPKDTVLSDQSVQQAEEDISRFEQLALEELTQGNIDSIVAKRQLLEIRLSMTVSSVVRMRKQGFDPDTASVEDMLAKLRQMEADYYLEQAMAQGKEVTIEQVTTMQEMILSVHEIAQAPAALLGINVKQYQLLTLKELHSSAVSMTFQYEQYQNDYEAVGTQVRGDLGDSIKKAFSNIPEILEEMGIAVTDANQRAVRILGYNQMEITVSSIDEMKKWDATVNNLIEHFKPSVVLEMIRDGKNPLDLSMEELEKLVEQYHEQLDVSDDEKYSRYLYQLEQQNEISESEREAYIGIFRLLHQIEKSDGAVIGAVINAGGEVNLRNLLTASRILKGKGINTKIDDVSEILQSSQTNHSISDQIEQAFVNDYDYSQVQYYQSLAGEMGDRLTPMSVRETAQGEWERILDPSLEQLAERLNQAPNQDEMMKAYYEQEAERVREIVMHGQEARNFLEIFSIPNTIENLQAANYLMQEEVSPIKELYAKRNRLTKSDQTELETAISSSLDQMDSEEEMMAAWEKTEKLLQDILTKSIEHDDISFDDIKHMQLLGSALRLRGSLSKRHNYEIPVMLEEGITTMNLTVLTGSNQTGQVKVSMEESPVGRIFADVQLRNDSVKGLVLCDQRNGFEALQSQRDSLTSRMESAGYLVKNISFGMDFKNRSEMATKRGDETTDTASLYQLAKILVRWVYDSAKQGE